MKKFLVAIVLLATFFSTPVTAQTHIVSGAEAKGGSVQIFLDAIATMQKQRVRVVLQGICQSSCTLYTALLASGQLCARPNTILAFHQFFYTTNEKVDSSGRYVSYEVDRYLSGAVARRIWNVYPPSIRKIILEVSPTGLPQVGAELKLSATRLHIPVC